MFEWDEAKREANLVKHALDFEDAGAFFDQTEIMSVPSFTEGEERWKSIGVLDGRFVTIVWTWRVPKRRIISMRRARLEESRAYRSVYGG